MSILHTTQLPTAKVFLDQGLASSIELAPARSVFKYVSYGSGIMSDPGRGWDTVMTELIKVAAIGLSSSSLRSSNANVSPWKQPIEWICIDSDYISYMVEVVNLTGNNEIILARCADQFT